MSDIENNIDGENNDGCAPSPSSSEHIISKRMPEPKYVTSKHSQPEKGFTPFSGRTNSGNKKRIFKPMKDLPPEQRREIASMGGKAGKGVKKPRYTKCVDCDIRNRCLRAFEDAETRNIEEEKARCIFELESRKYRKARFARDLHMFVSPNPEDMLDKVAVAYAKLEAITDKNPNVRDTANLLFFLMNIYKMKFGEKMFTMSVRKNLDSAPAMDVKDMMEAMRKEIKKEEEKEDEVKSDVKGEGVA